jgi:hypothetical protein
MSNTKFSSWADMEKVITTPQRPSTERPPGMFVASTTSLNTLLTDNIVLLGRN